LAAIVRLYRGETARYLELTASYIKKAHNAYAQIAPNQEIVEQQLDSLVQNLKTYVKETKDEKRTPAKKKALAEADFFNVLDGFQRTQSKTELLDTVMAKDASLEVPLDNDSQLRIAKHLEQQVAQTKKTAEALKQDINTILELYQIADKNLKLKSDKIWTTNNLSKADKNLEEALQLYQEATEQATYWFTNINWLQSRFPEAKYEDVVGLCKMADKADYVDEQDYSLNAGRYVGVVIEDENITKEEFSERIKEKSKHLKSLNNNAIDLESKISNLLKTFEC
jgi:type I restriction enzyme M protein